MQAAPAIEKRQWPRLISVQLTTLAEVEPPAWV
jgi:hypothetical protein